MSSPDPFEKWWPRVRDVGAALFGVYLINGQAMNEHPNLSVLGVGFAFVVVPVASLAQRWIRGKIEDDEEEDRWTGLP